MKPSLAERLNDVHPQRLRAQGEGDRKNLADLRPQIGEAVERALSLAHLTKQEAAYAMGYSDAGTVSRWCAGTERPLFDKLFTIAALRGPLVIALAALASDAEVTTTIRLKQTA